MNSVQSSWHAPHAVRRFSWGFALLSRQPPVSHQFDLRSIFEFTTWCGVLLAVSGLTGIAASMCLITLVLALKARRGFLALLVLSITGISGGFSRQSDEAIGSQLLTVLIALAICCWFRFQRHRDDKAIASRPQPIMAELV